MQEHPSLDGDYSGGQVDAFRHAYWMATLSQKIRWRAARSLGRSHERANKLQFKKKELEEGFLPDAAATEMDLWNNNIGIQLAKENPNATPQELESIIIAAILDGQLQVIRKNQQGQSLNCEGNVIAETDWQGTWDNTRCLVPSNKSRARL